MQKKKKVSRSERADRHTEYLKLMVLAAQYGGGWVRFLDNTPRLEVLDRNDDYGTPLGRLWLQTAPGTPDAFKDTENLSFLAALLDLVKKQSSDYQCVFGQRLNVAFKERIRATHEPEDATWIEFYCMPLYVEIEDYLKAWMDVQSVTPAENAPPLG